MLVGNFVYLLAITTRNGGGGGGGGEKKVLKSCLCIPIFGLKNGIHCLCLEVQNTIFAVHFYKPFVLIYLF